MSGGRVHAQEEPEAADPPVVIGERLFLETRFAQYFFANAGGNVNRPLAAGDPVVATVRGRHRVPHQILDAGVEWRAAQASPELARMRLGASDIARLAAFLRALNEDYE